MPNKDEQLKSWLKEQAQISRLYVHDFKNPIAAISANLNFLQTMKENLDEDLNEAVNDSLSAIKSLLHMMENYSTISMLEAGEQIQAQPINFAEFFSKIIDDCNLLLPYGEPEITLENPLPQASCQWPRLFATLALSNLIMASAHNTPGRGKIYLGASADQSNVRISVRDTGIPIGNEYLDTSFDREFQSAAKTLSSARYGRGMAMYAIKLAAIAMGGTVEILPKAAIQEIVLTLPINTSSQ